MDSSKPFYPELPARVERKVTSSGEEAKNEERTEIDELMMAIIIRST